MINKTQKDIITINALNTLAKLNERFAKDEKPLTKDEFMTIQLVIWNRTKKEVKNENIK